MNSLPVGTLGDAGHPATGPEIYNNIVTNIRSLSHPLSCLLHVVFKFTILVSYVKEYFVLPYVLGLVTGTMPEFICIFVLISLLVLLDFWIVKNCTSTMLAGIIWYYNIKDNGSFNPVHKRVKEDIFLNSTETQYFWIVLYIWPTLWIFNILFKLSVLQLPSLILSMVIFLGGAINLFNCIQCSKDKHDKLAFIHNKFTSLMELKL